MKNRLPIHDHPISFQDLSASLDRELHLYADLLAAVEESPEYIDGTVLRELASALHGYLRRREVLEHYFVDRVLTFTFENDAAEEIRRIKRRLP